jgi:hypothetical protein
MRSGQELPRRGLCGLYIQKRRAGKCRSRAGCALVSLHGRPHVMPRITTLDITGSPDEDKEAGQSDPFSRRVLGSGDR